MEIGNLADPEPDKNFSVRGGNRGPMHLLHPHPATGNSAGWMTGNEDSRLDPITRVGVPEMVSRGAARRARQGGEKQEIPPSALGMMTGKPDLAGTTGDED